MRDAVRNKEWWEGRRARTQDPSTNNLHERGMENAIAVAMGIVLLGVRRQALRPGFGRGRAMASARTHNRTRRVPGVSIGVKRRTVNHACGLQQYKDTGVGCQPWVSGWRHRSGLRMAVHTGSTAFMDLRAGLGCRHHGERPHFMNYCTALQLSNHALAVGVGIFFELQN